jgi:CHAT domain-containing protein
LEARAGLSTDVPANLATEHRQLRDRLAFRTTALLALGPTSPARAAVQADVSALERRFETLDADIRTRDARYAALINPTPRTAAELRALVPSGTTVVQFLLGHDASFAFVVDATRVRVRELGPGPLIEHAARELAARVSQSGAREAQAGATLAASALAARILTPLADLLGSGRLAIVPDGALQYVPFAMLPHPRRNRPLVVDHDLVTLPSLSALVELRAATSARPVATRSGLVLGDPVLSADDGRVRGAAGLRAPSAPDQVARAARGAGLASIGRLPHTRREAESIAALVGNTTVALDFDASRDRLLSDDVRQYRLIHLASHGLIDSRQPALSGVVLSLVDDAGAPRPGFVGLRDIYGLRLSADLVVLSACRTALGTEVRGEGLIGLTRGFMYAGAPRVVASLWDVRDDSTAIFMQAFYRAYIRDRVPAASALRRAQLQLRQDPRFAAPYHWAGFVLHGDWR